jgi:hypothetical protein
MFSSEDFISSDKFLSLVDHDIAYIKMDTLYNSCEINWRGNSYKYREAKIWITGHSDFGITKEIYDKYKSMTNVWFTINKETIEHNLFAIPLGLTNDCDDSYIHRIFGNTDIMIEVLKCEKKEKNLVYMNFTIGTYPIERTFVWDTFKDKPWATKGIQENTLEGRRVFLEEIRNHKFVLCPRGHGVDTHRLWETLYMGSIPIVKRHVALEEFSDLPILWIDNWEEITEDMLNIEYIRIKNSVWNMDKLCVSYWKNKIKSYLQ